MFLDDIVIAKEKSGSRIMTHTYSTPALIRSFSNGLFVKVVEPTPLKVYALNGNCLYNIYLPNNSSKILKLSSGVYVVCIGNERYKYHIK